MNGSTAKKILQICGITTISAAMALTMATTSASAVEAPAAQQIYIDCAASVQGDGSIDSPYNSLDKVNGADLEPGTQVLFKRGSVCDTGLQIADAHGTEANPIVISSYGDTSKKATIDGNGIRETILLYNSSNIVVTGLDIANTDVAADQHKYIRRGVAIVNENAGELDNIVITGNTIHDVLGEGQKDLGGSGAIQLESYGHTYLQSAAGTRTYTDGQFDKTDTRSANMKIDFSRESKASYYDGVVIANNDIDNVSRSAINMSTDWRCREEVGWVCDANTEALRNQYAWTPNLNLSIVDNHVEHVGGDAIVVQMSDGALVEGNYVNDAANYENTSNAAVWVWNADNTLFQYNEVTGTNKKSGNNDGTAWDFDYGTRNTVYQYNYSHDNAGGMLLTCACSGRTGYAIGSVFRYNISVNDGVNAAGCEGSQNSNRNFFLAGVKDMSFYNNTIVLPNAAATMVQFNGSSPSGLTFANNLYIAPGTVADENAKISNTQQLSLFWNSNVYVGSDAAASNWPLVGENGNTHVALADYVAETGLDLAAVAAGDLSTLATGSFFTDAAGRAMATSGSVDYAGNAVPSWGKPDVGAYQTSEVSDFAVSGAAGDLTAGADALTVDVPGNATVAVKAAMSDGATLTAQIPNDRGFVQKTEGTGEQTLYVRTANDLSQLTLQCTGTGSCSNITLHTVDDSMWDGSFESINWGGGALSPWTYGNKNNEANYDTGYRQSDELRNDEQGQTGYAAAGAYAGRIGWKKWTESTDNNPTTTLNQRGLRVVPGATYTIGFWATVGANNDDTHTITLRAYARPAGTGTGATFSTDVYSRPLIGDNGEGITCEADEANNYQVYCSTEFTVPGNAATTGAVWVRISQDDIKIQQGNSTFVDSVTMVREDQAPTVKGYAGVVSTASENGVLSARVDVDAQPAAHVTWQKQDADGNWTPVTIETVSATGNELTTNSNTLTIANAALSDAGTYRAVASNALGTATSEPITFAVTPIDERASLEDTIADTEAKIDGLKAEDYTEESWNTLQEALQNAKTLAQSDYTDGLPAQLSKAEAALTSAFEGLVEAEEPTGPTDPEEPTDPDNPDNPGDTDNPDDTKPGNDDKNQGGNTTTDDQLSNTGSAITTVIVAMMAAAACGAITLAARRNHTK